jgi:hypothetical protein
LGNAIASGIDEYDASAEIRFTDKGLDATGLYYFNDRWHDAAPLSAAHLTIPCIRTPKEYMTLN